MSREDTSNSSDAILVTRCKNGEVDAFGALYERYFERIYKYVRVRVTELHTAEDITETVFLRAFEAIERYQERGFAFSSYLYKIAQNQLVDYYRKNKEQEPIEAADQVIDELPSPDEGLILNDQVQEVHEKLVTLPEDYQEVIRLRVILEMSTAEVAEWLDRSEGAVRVLLHRALGALRNALRDSGDE